MAQVKVYYDQQGNTLTVWFGNPQDEAVAEEAGDEVILMKGKDGNVIGFEKLNYTERGYKLRFYSTRIRRAEALPQYV